MARNPPTLLTQAEYARHRKARGLPGGSREAVRKAVDEGRISTINGSIDPAVADIQWEQNTRARLSPQAVAPAPAAAPGDGAGQAAADLQPGAAVSASANGAGPVDKGYADARARREHAEAELAEIEAAQARGSMVLRDDVDRAFFEMFRETRDRLASCARRLAAEVSSIGTAEACEEVIDREHRIVLELLSTSFREKVGASPGTVAA